jgi:hypothetical protein
VKVPWGRKVIVMSISDIPTLDPSFGPDVLAAAEEATVRFAVAHPEMDERYGERGRAYAVHDNAYLVAWVQNAVELKAPDTLRRNLRWLLDLLVAREFPRDWFLESLDIVTAVMLERGLLGEADAAGIVRPIIGELAAGGGAPS